MTQKWKRLNFADLAQVLAYDEIEKLNTISLSSDISAICQTQLDSIADAFRSSFAAKGYTYDVRDHYVPNGYSMYVLTLARYFICTRFPQSDGTFLDDPRKDMYEKAQEMLEDPTLGVPDPDYSDDPELSGTTQTADDASITLPWQRIISRPGQMGFSHPYASDYQLSGYIF